MRLGDITQGWWNTHSPYRDPPDPPEYWATEVRRVTDVEGVELVVYRNQDGETYVMDADDWKELR